MNQKDQTPSKRCLVTKTSQIPNTGFTLAKNDARRSCSFSASRLDLAYIQSGTDGVFEKQVSLPMASALDALSDLPVAPRSTAILAASRTLKI
jgi:hypothetical protein